MAAIQPISKINKTNKINWPRSNTAKLGPVTGPIRNNLINNIILLSVT